MAFGIYVHIPFCLQKCRYCDFATVEGRTVDEMTSYIEILLKEVRSRQSFFHGRKVQSIYFGGGTPSLLPLNLMEKLLHTLRTLPFEWSPSLEVTLEVNPATVDEEKLRGYLDLGINRFSLGVQSFNDKLLKLCGRKHDSQDARNTLKLFKKYTENFSFDLIYGLPQQDFELLNADLNELKDFQPPHLSTYLLTVPPGHEMAKNRPSDEVQLQMHHHIEESVRAWGLEKYEISNFARPGYESIHNQLYWDDSSYWGLGVSAHSYEPKSKAQNLPDIRYWNPRSMIAYDRQVQDLARPWTPLVLPEKQFERLQLHESLTDFCYTHLRTKRGVSAAAISSKFGDEIALLVEGRLQALSGDALVALEKTYWSLTTEGEGVSNEVFRQLTFNDAELTSVTNNTY